MDDNQEFREQLRAALKIQTDVCTEAWGKRLDEFADSVCAKLDQVCESLDKLLQLQAEHQRQWEEEHPNESSTSKTNLL